MCKQPFAPSYCGVFQRLSYINNVELIVLAEKSEMNEIINSNKIANVVNNFQIMNLHQADC